MTSRVLLLTAIVGAAALGLAACGGGGGSGSGDAPALTQGDLDRIARDSRVVSLAEIFSDADTLVMPAAVLEWFDTVDGETSATLGYAPGDCHQSECVFLGGDTVYEAASIMRPSRETLDIAEVTRAELGRRAGMNTSVLEGTLHSPGTDASYGIWGEHGFASAHFSARQLSETRVHHVTFAAVVGQPTGSNPSGLGSATWSGPAEAIHFGNDQRLSGTATVAMADLSMPAVDVDVVIDGNSIGSSAWDNISLSNGRFEAGELGSETYVEGNFYGPQASGHGLAAHMTQCPGGGAAPSARRTVRGWFRKAVPP